MILVCVLNRRDVRLLVLRCTTCQNEIRTVVSAEPFDYLRPAPGVPKLFLARRPWMQNNVRLADVPTASERIGFFVRRLRQLQVQRGGNIPDAERFEQRQIVIDCVQVAHTDVDKISVEPGTAFRLIAHPV